jgi:hypothetical protein
LPPQRAKRVRGARPARRPPGTKATPLVDSRACRPAFIPVFFPPK